MKQKKEEREVAFLSLHFHSNWINEPSVPLIPSFFSSSKHSLVSRSPLFLLSPSLSPFDSESSWIHSISIPRQSWSTCLLPTPLSFLSFSSIFWNLIPPFFPSLWFFFPSSFSFFFRSLISSSLLFSLLKSIQFFFFFVFFLRIRYHSLSLSLSRSFFLFVLFSRSKGLSSWFPNELINFSFF